MKYPSKRRFKFIVGIICAIVGVIMFAVSCVYVYVDYFSSRTSNMRTVNANAEESSSSSAPSNLNMDDYPTANLLPYPYDIGEGYVASNFSCIPNADGSLDFGGNAMGGSFRFTLWNRSVGEGLQLDGTYTLSVSAPLFGAFQVNLFVDGSSTYFFCTAANGSATFDLTGKELTSVQIRFTAPTLAIGLFSSNVKIMFNKGDTAYPYAPNFNVLYQAGVTDGYVAGNDDGYNQGYDEGYVAGDEVGYDRGYDEGYEDAEEDINVGILRNSMYGVRYPMMVDGVLTYKNSEKFRVDPYYSQSGLLGVGFSAFFEKYESEIAFPNSATVTLEFVNELPYQYARFVYSGDALLPFTFQFIDREGNYHDIITLMDETGHYSMYIDPADDVDLATLTIKGIRFEFDNAADIEIMQISTAPGTYTLGYQSGYNDGHSVGRTDGYSEGFDAGNVVGDEKGYLRGYDKGRADAYDKQAASGTVASSVRSFVFSLFDAPIDTFMSVFNFEVDGFNIGALVTFIISIALIAFVLKLIL